MDNYCRGQVVEQPSSSLESDFGLDLPYNEIPVVKVKRGSKINNLMGYATKVFKADTCRSVVFTGIGPACSKVVSCVEVMKRKQTVPLHQVTRLTYKRVDEYWEPQDEANPEKLDRLVVKRDIPAICILLSKDAMCDPAHPGYQPPGDFNLVQRPNAVSSKRRRRNAPPASGAGSDNQWVRPEKPKAKARREQRQGQEVERLQGSVRKRKGGENGQRNIDNTDARKTEQIESAAAADMVD